MEAIRLLSHSIQVEDQFQSIHVSACCACLLLVARGCHWPAGYTLVYGGGA